MKFIKLILLIAWASTQPLHALDNSAPNPDLPDLSSITGLPPELCNIIADNLDDLSNLTKYQILKREPDWEPCLISSSAKNDYLAVSFHHNFENPPKALLFKVNKKTARWELYKTYNGCDSAVLSPNGKHIALMYHHQPTDEYNPFNQPTIKATAAIENIDGSPLMGFRIDNQSMIDGVHKIFSWSADSKQLLGNFNGYHILWKQQQNWRGKVERALDGNTPLFLGNKLFFTHFEQSMDALKIFLIGADEKDTPDPTNSTALWDKDESRYYGLIKSSNVVGILSSEIMPRNNGIGILSRDTITVYSRIGDGLKSKIAVRDHNNGSTAIVHGQLLSPDGNFLALHKRKSSGFFSDDISFIEIYRHDTSKKIFEYTGSIELEKGITNFDWLADGKGLVLVTGDNEIEIFVTQGKTLQLKNDRLAFFDLHRSFFKNATLVIGGLIACGLIYYVWSKFSWDDVVDKAATADHTYSPGYPLFTSAFNKLFFTSNPQK